MNAGAPGPPLRYLYVHPTAKSASDMSTCMAPALWHRSQIISAPDAWTCAVTAAVSWRAPVR